MLSSISHLRVSTPAAAGCGHETNYRIFGFILGDFVLLIQVNLQHRDDWYVQHVAQVPFLHVWTWDTGERPQVCLSLLYRLYISVWQLRGQTNTQDVNWNCALCCCLLKQFSFSRRARGVSVNHLTGIQTTTRGLRSVHLRQITVNFGFCSLLTAAVWRHVCCDWLHGPDLGWTSAPLGWAGSTELHLPTRSLTSLMRLWLNGSKSQQPPS